MFHLPKQSVSTFRNSFLTLSFYLSIQCFIFSRNLLHFSKMVPKWEYFFSLEIFFWEKKSYCEVMLGQTLYLFYFNFSSMDIDPWGSGFFGEQVQLTQNFQGKYVHHTVQYGSQKRARNYFACVRRTQVNQDRGHPSWREHSKNWWCLKNSVLEIIMLA